MPSGLVLVKTKPREGNFNLLLGNNNMRMSVSTHQTLIIIIYELIIRGGEKGSGGYHGSLAWSIYFRTYLYIYGLLAGIKNNKSD